MLDTFEAHKVRCMHGARRGDSLYVVRDFGGGVSLRKSYLLVDPRSCVFTFADNALIERAIAHYTDAGWFHVVVGPNYFFDAWAHHNAHAFKMDTRGNYVK